MMVRKIQEVLSKEKPDIVLVVGDTNSVLSGALAANKLHIKIGHIEAGLRSHDVAMVEETNRIITDHIADILFAPTPEVRENVLEEDINPEKIHVTGNTIVDAVLTYKELSDKKLDIVKKLNLEKNNYITITAHRPENVDIHERLNNMLEGLRLVKEKYNLPIVWPIHPRTAKTIKQFNLKIPEGIKIIPPMGYLEFLQLEANSKIILTDSGGVQEEACILKVPCVTMRDTTERPETLKIGSNVLVSVDPQKILEGVNQMLSRDTSWKNPFGDGHAGESIINIITQTK
jgi:UDP-N-acetylglucosamine 2-epimerase (non-hydrolysing)